MVTEAAGAARGLTSAATAGLAPAAQQAGATSKAVDNALTVFRMPINLVRPLHAWGSDTLGQDGAGEADKAVSLGIEVIGVRVTAAGGLGP